MTDRPTDHDGGGTPQRPTASPFPETKADDSYAIPIGPNPTGGGAASSAGGVVSSTSGVVPSAKRISQRISQKHLERVALDLSERDKKILSDLRHCRYLLTKQVQRLYFRGSATPAAGLRAAHRNLDRLKGIGLTASLARRIGGVRAGSGSLIWYLTEAGERLLRMADTGGAHTRKPFFEPSPHFLAHILSTAECYVQLTEICEGHDLKLLGVEMETDCWREYGHKGKLATLRPDLFAVTHCGAYEDRWFFEIDRDTESPVTVVEKCRRYHDYYRSGLEQKQHEVFPLAVWIVPDAKRKDSVVAHIRGEFPRHPKIFIVITPDELEPLIRQGVDGRKLC